jgi:hypothetical protein
MQIPEITDWSIIPPEILAEIDKVGKDVVSVMNSAFDTIENQTPPFRIYHYTDDNGLRGILETGRLWLTDIFSMNDPSELSHGFSCAIRILMRRAWEAKKSVAAEDAGQAKELVPANAEERANAFFTRVLDGIVNQDRLADVVKFFALSFSATFDELGQWRAYADDGRGYALGFDTEKLEGAFSIVPRPSDLVAGVFPLSYSDSGLEKNQQQIIDKIVPLVTYLIGKQLLPGIEAVCALKVLLIIIFMNITFSALAHKHQAYSNENEYRFIEAYTSEKAPTGLKYRSRPYSLVRYREFDWRSPAPDALKYIVVGPSADPNRGERFARDCLREFHPNPASVLVFPSGIPYRAL